MSWNFRVDTVQQNYLGQTAASKGESSTGWSKSLCAPDDYNPHTIDDLKMAITEYIRNVDRAVLNTVFGNTVRRVNKCLETGGGHLNITCNFLYCNHQVHRDFLITLYNVSGPGPIPVFRVLQITGCPSFRYNYISLSSADSGWNASQVTYLVS